MTTITETPVPIDDLLGLLTENWLHGQLVVTWLDADGVTGSRRYEARPTHPDLLVFAHADGSETTAIVPSHWTAEVIEVDCGEGVSVLLGWKFVDDGRTIVVPIRSDGKNSPR